MEMVKYLDERIESMIKRPLMWARELEALELQFLCHLEFRHFALTGDKNAGRKLTTDWIKLGCVKFNDSRSNCYLTTILKDKGLGMEQMVEAMSEYWMRVKSV